jgi:hypothetical protein
MVKEWNKLFISTLQLPGSNLETKSRNFLKEILQAKKKKK